MQVSTLAYDDYIGRLGIGRVFQGRIKANQEVSYCRADGKIVTTRIGKIFQYIGIKRVEVKEIGAGDIAVISGIPSISIGETICHKENPIPLELIQIEEPTLSMDFCVNTSPFAGRSGKFLTTLQIKARLLKELEVNVGMKVEDNPTTDSFKVSGRGELHLSVLIETMRREGFELLVSRPKVIFKEIDGVKCEPMERVTLDVPSEYVGAVVEKLGQRKGDLLEMNPIGSRMRVEYSIPSRCLFGYRSEFLTATHGEGVINTIFDGYKPFEFVSMDGYDRKDENWFDSIKVKPHNNPVPAADGGMLTAELKPFSWNVIRLKK